jgi:transglutaminase-like putative cysteine protease
MKRKLILVLLVFLLMGLTACLEGVVFRDLAPVSTSKEESSSTVASPVAFSPAPTTPIPTKEPTNTPLTTPVPAERNRYGPAFGIAYGEPERYLAQGEQSQIREFEALNVPRASRKSLAHLGDIYRWLHQSFESYSAGGKTIGMVTVEQLLSERRVGGCHDVGLVYAAVVRELGYPAVMNRTNSIAWVERFQSGTPDPHVGHVFVEVYVGKSWVLIDPTNGWYVAEGYDPTNPVIPLQGQVAGANQERYGFSVERKGVDVWDMGLRSPEESTQAMDRFAQDLNLEGIIYPDYEFARFER